MELACTNLTLSDPGQGHVMLCNVSPFTSTLTVNSYISAWAQVIKLLLSMFVYQIIIYKMYKNHHA